MADISTLDGLALGALIAKKKLSALEAVDAAIARAERLNPTLNAIVFADFERARTAAKGKIPKGLFSGVPTLLKDMRAGAVGMPTRSGSRFVPATLADHDSTLVARYRAAGLIPLGKTNVPEFGILPTTESRLYGPAHNPWNTEHSTGGSSGGSACAVAAGIVPIAHATDGGGSIRIPAACCGLVGLKVSRGRITQGPDFADATSGLSVDNMVSRSVRDTAAALDASCGVDYGDPYTAPPPEGSYLDGIKRKSKRLRIAVSYKTLDGKTLHPDVVAAVKKTAKLCESLGHVVEEKSPPLDPRQTTPAFMTLWAANVAYGVGLLSKLSGIAPSTDVVEGLTLGLYHAGLAIPATTLMAAKQVLDRAARTMAQFHETYDVWLNPTLGAPPIRLGIIQVDEQDPGKAFAPILDYVPFTALQNATGQPAIQLPLNFNKAGLPIGVQFVARYGGEMTLLKLAAELEKASPWADRHPKLPAPN
ncbi:MAG TPA: amidase family protein [Rhizomicrobium sp.]|nr:amidase family protein [Rhizomicrobium sp.]